MTTEIKAGGKERPFLFNYSALKKFCKETGKKLSDFSAGELDFEEIEALMYYGFQAGAKSNNIEFTCNLSDMEGWINDDFSLIEQVSQAVADSFDKPKKNPSKRIPLPPKKKK